MTDVLVQSPVADVTIGEVLPAGHPAAAPRPIEVEDPTGKRPQRRGRTIRAPKWSRRMLGPLVLLGVWILLTNGHMVSATALASPGSVLSAGRQLWSDGTLPADILTSLYRVGWGLFFGVLAGLALAVVAGFFRLGEYVIDSSLNILRMVPVIALLPMIILWVGIGESAKILLVALGTMFPIYINTFAAIRGVDQKLIEVGRAFGLGRLGLIWRVLIPGSLPGFLVGLRWALGGAWLLLFFAEQINANSGVGYLITQAQSWNETNVIMLGVAFYGLFGLVGDQLVRMLERALLSWRRGFEGT